MSYGRELINGRKGEAVSMAIFHEEETGYSDHWYVFWVKTGLEEKAAVEIKAAFNGAATPLQLTVETFFRKQGKVKKETHFAFPGYVFVATEIENDEFVIRARECVHKSKSVMKLLCYDNVNEAAVREEERVLIERIWQGKNCVETSTGFIEGDRIVVNEGPFIGRESIIKEIHLRRRQAIVEIEFMGEVRRITIGLEIIEKLP